ncbi:hypothetical protein [Nonomuraea diastatica]|uniref:hypothetical protein n=1 Tax=Nonomuraea diastatica TaxID=1848329 RepID=UPI001C700FA5|nr:hypothetical protein [Nonomuraea diastatica]
MLAYDAMRLLTDRGRRAIRLSDGMLEWWLADLPVEAVAPACPAGRGTRSRPRGWPVYLDYNATTPVDPRVSEAMAGAPERPVRQPLQPPLLR